MLMWEKLKRMEEEPLSHKDIVIKTKVYIKQLESPTFLMLLMTFILPYLMSLATKAA